MAERSPVVAEHSTARPVEHLGRSLRTANAPWGPGVTIPPHPASRSRLHATCSRADETADGNGVVDAILCRQHPFFRQWVR